MPRAKKVTLVQKTRGGAWLGQWRDPITGRQVKRSMRCGSDKIRAQGVAKEIERRLIERPGAVVDVRVLAGWTVKKGLEDCWRLDLGHYQWKEIACPIKGWGHTALLDGPSNRMLVFGGNFKGKRTTRSGVSN